MPFLFEALRSVGDASTAVALARVARKYEQDKGHYARALCALAIPAQRALLVRLREDSDWLVAREARLALERLQQQEGAQQLKVRS